jgi:hypothetical protein
MCCCGKPVINGEPGYSWDGKTFSVRKPDPPALADGDSLLFDEPGRCGGMDCHCHHFRLVKARHGYALLVRHGGGDERVSIPNYHPAVKLIPSLVGLDTNARYWMFHLLYSVQRKAASEARDRTTEAWRKAAAEKRIKTRKSRGAVKVWVESSAKPREGE